MKFITENDLRAIYKTEPFTSYEPKAGERLTPGARQFLIDRGVNMYGERREQKKQAEPKPEKAAQNTMLLRYKIEGLRLHFLAAVKELLRSDVLLAQELTALARQLSLLVLYISGKCQVADLFCRECSGFTAENFSEAVEDCVCLSEFSMQLENAQTMLMLAGLRNELHIFAAELEFADMDGEVKKTLARKINQVINRLSQLLCQAMGGKECQKKA